MSEFWDQFQGADEYIKFESHGDTVAGRVKSIGVKEWDDGSTSPQVFLEDADGTVKCVTASQVLLRSALAEKRPSVGDLLAVTYVSDGIAKPGRSAPKQFKVDVKRGEGAPVAPAAPAPAADADPFGSF